MVDLLKEGKGGGSSRRGSIADGLAWPIYIRRKKMPTILERWTIHFSKCISPL